MLRLADARRLRRLEGDRARGDHERGVVDEDGVGQAGHRVELDDLGAEVAQGRDEPRVLLGEGREVRRLPVGLLVLRDDLRTADQRPPYGDPLQLRDRRPDSVALLRHGRHPARPGRDVATSDPPVPPARGPAKRECPGCDA